MYVSKIMCARLGRRQECTQRRHIYCQTGVITTKWHINLVYLRLNYAHKLDENCLIKAAE